MIGVDTIILIVLVIFTLLGLIRGFIQELGSIIGFILGVFLAGKFAWPVAEYIRGGLMQYPAIADSLSYVVGFFVVFVVVTFVFGILIKTVDKIFNMFAILPFLKTINRLGGAAIGLVEGVLFVSLVVYMLTSLPINLGATKQIKDSASGSVFLGIATVLKPFLPHFETIDLSTLLTKPPIPIKVKQ